MAKYQNHICFISDQNVAELLGAKLPELGCAKIHAVVSAKMQRENKGEIFKKTCLKNGIPCSLYSLNQIQIRQIEALLDSIWFEKSEETWAINITGGTKIMSLAAYTWAARNHIDALYIDTANQTAQLYHDNQWHERELPDLLKIDALLGLYGYEIEKRTKSSTAQSAREAARSLIEIIAKGRGLKAIHALNALALKAAADPCLAAIYQPEDELNTALGICKSANCLDYANFQVIFKDDDARRWCMGLWLEEFVQGVLARLEAESRISSWASSANVSTDGTRNELDAVFTANNRLYVIECKTSRLASDAPATASILYKADSINGRVGGIYTQSMLCSLDALKPEERRRAKSMGIKTVIGANLKNLRKIIIEWTSAK